MAKQLTILFWGFIYGEVIGYVLSALSGSPFEPLQSGLIAMVGGFIAVNCLLLGAILVDCRRYLSSIFRNFAHYDKKANVFLKSYGQICIIKTKTFI